MNTQPPLFPQYSRPTDPGDAIDAGDHAGISEGGANVVRPHSLRHRILRVYAALPPDQSGLTDDEPAWTIDLPVEESGRRRVSDLVRLGLIEPTGKRRPSTVRVSRPKRECRITPFGREVLRHVDGGKTWTAP